MLITLHRMRSTRLTIDWRIEHNGRLMALTTGHVKPKKRVQQMRNILRKAIGDSNAQFTFLGNTYVNGIWITEWMMK